MVRLPFTMVNKKKSFFISRKKLIAAVALTTILSLFYEESLIQALKKRVRRLSISLGDGECEWVAALDYRDVGFPSDQSFLKTIIAGYPSGDKRLTFVQLEGLTGLSARDEWDFKFLGTTNQPFIKANYPHHEGIWGWGDVGEQVVLVVSELKKVLVEYHDILWDIGYAQTFEEAYERIENLYKEEQDGVQHENPPVSDFLIWRDLRAFDEIHWYSWFIDYYMEGGLMRDMFNHEMTVPSQWQMSILPNFFTKHEVRHGRFVGENQTVEPSYDPMCATLSKGCYPVMVLDPAKLVDHDYGAAEARKLALVVNGTEGFTDWMIDEDAWECVWKEIVIERKGIKTFLDRVTLDYESYEYSHEMKNEMWSETNRLIEKYDVYEDEIAVELVKILKGHRDAIGVTAPTDPLPYEELMGYHLKFPPFFPNQKPFESDDDFFLHQQEMFLDPEAAAATSIIDTRRAWFEAEMEKKRERKVNIKYYDADGWTRLPTAGLSSLTPYATDTTTKIDYKYTTGEFATSGRTSNVAALFEGYLYVDPVVTQICIASDDGSKLYLDGALKVDNDGRHAYKRKCASVSTGTYKLDLEYFEAGGGKVMILEWGKPGELRTVPPRAWSSEGLRRKHRQLLRMNELLEEDLRNLKETDFMGPTTRAEYNFRKKKAAEANQQGDNLRKNKPAYDFSSFDEILKKRKSDQLKIAKSFFGDN